MAKAYRCDICGKFYEKTSETDAKRIKLTLAVAKCADVKIDICDGCYEYMVKYIGMEEKAYWPEAKKELVTPLKQKEAAAEDAQDTIPVQSGAEHDMQ